MKRVAVLLALVVAGLAAVAAAVVILVWPSSPDEPVTPPRTAAIVDQLGVAAPDPAFVAAATRTLEEAGYTVDYYPSEQVTVDFYRDLPQRGYGLVIIRAHSGFAFQSAETAADEVHGSGETFLFSSEPYDQDKYVPEQRQRRLSMAFLFDPTGTEAALDPSTLVRAFETAPRYFGIKPGFIGSSTRGKFPNTTVILMGCNGLASEALAKAFVKKGAQVVVGWDDLVTADHTDAATERLLSLLLADQLPIEAAVAQTAAEVGPDPAYGGKLLVYR